MTERLSVFVYVYLEVFAVEFLQLNTVYRRINYKNSIIIVFRINGVDKESFSFQVIAMSGAIEILAVFENNYYFSLAGDSLGFALKSSYFFIFFIALVVLYKKYCLKWNYFYF